MNEARGLAPASIGHRASWDGKRSDPLLAPFWKRAGELADEAAPRPPMPGAADYLAARRYNDRSRVDHAWQFERAGLSALMTLRCAAGFDASQPGPNGGFAGQDDRLLEWFWGMLSAPTWAVVAHLPNRDLPALRQPVALDLAACEMAMAVAEAREILRPWMDAVSETLSDSALAEVERRVVRPFAEDGPRAPGAGWADPPRIHNNWSGVCGGSMLAAAASLLAQGVDAPWVHAAMDRALDVLNLYIERAFTPAGECVEGLGYWAYGLGYACMGWMRLERAVFESRVNLDRLRQVAGYPCRANLFGDTFYGRGDATCDRAPAIGWVGWLAAVTQDAWLTEWVRRRGQIPLSKGLVPWRDLDAVRNAEQARSDAAQSQRSDAGGDAPAMRHVPDMQVAIFRAATVRGPLTVTLAGGNNGESHNHNDIGHVNVWLGGEPLLVDLGCPGYTADFFGPRRYAYLSAGSRGHNVPLVRGWEQRAGADAAGRELAVDPNRFALDVSTAYPVESGLVAWTRELGVQDGVLHLTDRFRLAQDGEVALRFWSPHKPAPRGRSVRIGALALRHSPAPVAVRGESIRAGDHRLRAFRPAQRLYCHEAVYRTGAGEELTVVTQLAPASVSKRAPRQEGNA